MTHTSMAVASMVHQVRYRNKHWCLLTLMVFACSNERMTIDLNITELQTQQGVTYANRTPFTGMAFRLFPGTADTMEIQHYKNGKPHGQWSQFYHPKQLKEVRSFVSGKKDGRYHAWWPNGQLRIDYNFRDDEMEGTCRDWNEHGVLIQLKNYHRGQEQGLQQMWTGDGKIWANYEARNGRNYGLTGIKGCTTIWQGDSIRSH